MPPEHRVTRRVEFADTDAAGIMHFTHFFRYMETTEHLFLASLGFPLHADAGLAWPRVRATCEYQAPLRFADLVEIQLTVRQRGEKSVTYDFVFHKDAQEVARGSLTTVCVALVAGQPMKAVPIPAALAEKLDGK